MEPVSVAASAITIFAALTKIIEITSNAQAISRILSEKSQKYEDISSILSASVTILHRILSLRGMIENLQDEELKGLNIPSESIEDHLNTAKTLYTALEARKKAARGRLGRFLTIWKHIYRPQTVDAELDDIVRRFNASGNCISVLLNIFQTNVHVIQTLDRELTLHRAAALSTRETCVEGFRTLSGNHQSTKAQLDLVLCEQRDSRTRSQKTAKLADQSFGSLHLNWAKSDSAITSLGSSLQNTTAEVKQIGQTLSETHAQIQGRLKTIDNSINTLATKDRFISLPRRRFSIPYPRNKCFTGRQGILADMGSHLHVHVVSPTQKESARQSEAKTGVCSIYGLPGIGKSQLAIEFAYLHEPNFTHVFWIAADSNEKIDQGLVDIARLLGITASNAAEDKDNIIMAAREWLKTPSPEIKWLLIFDNVDNFRLLNPFWSDFQQGAVLITSRDSIPGLQSLSASSRSFALKTFSREEGMEMVKKRLKHHIKGAFDDTAAADLAKQFGYFPLYMDQMTSHIQKYPITLEEFRAQIQSELDLQQLQESSADNAWYQDGLSVAAAIRAHVGTLDAPPKLMLTTLAFFDPDSIPERLLLSIDGKVPYLSSAFKRQKLLGTLWQRSCVNLGGANQEKCINIHRLVRDAALRLDSTALPEAFEHAVHLLRQSFPLHGESRDHMVENWAECEIFQPHVLSLHERYLELRGSDTIQPSFDLIELVYSCAWYLCERGRFQLSTELISSIHDDYIKLLKLDSNVPPVFLADIYTVQLFWHNETKHQESLVELAEKALQIREDAVQRGLMDQYHPNRANSFMNVGVVMAQMDTIKAIEMHSKALEIRLGSDRYAAGQTHGLALNYLNIGRCWWMVGELEQAAACFEDCLNLMRNREDHLGIRLPLTAWALSALGIVRADQNNLVDATRLVSESLPLHIQTLGKTHQKTLACYYRLAWICQRIGEFHRAEQLLLLTLEAYETFQASQKPEIARTKYKLSQVLQESGACRERWASLRRESHQLLARILKPECNEMMDEIEYTEKDYDSAVPYFYR